MATETISSESVNRDKNVRRNEFYGGVKATFPLVVGAIPFGIIFGAVAVNAGLSPAATQAMSLFVFAGSAQFVAAGLVGGGAGFLLIVATTFIVNLRHGLYAISLAPHMAHLSQRWLLPLGFWLTDESYLVVIKRYDEADDSSHKHWFFLGSALFMYLNWQLCTYIGIRAGQSIPDPEKWGLDFALPVTFIGMLVPLLQTRPVLLCVLIAGSTAILFHELPNQLGLIVATLSGVIAGVVAQRFSGGRSESV